MVPISSPYLNRAHAVHITSRPKGKSEITTGSQRRRRRGWGTAESRIPLCRRQRYLSAHHKLENDEKADSPPPLPLCKDGKETMVYWGRLRREIIALRNGISGKILSDKEVEPKGVEETLSRYIGMCLPYRLSRAGILPRIRLFSRDCRGRCRGPRRGRGEMENGWWKKQQPAATPLRTEGQTDGGPTRLGS